MRRFINKSKRYINIILAVFIFVDALLPVYAADVPAELEISPDIMIYEDIINNRSYVEDTFMGDKFPAGNPYADMYYFNESNYMYMDLLEKYHNDAAFAAGVNIWYTIEHTGDQLMEIPDAVCDYFASEEEWTRYINGTSSKNYAAVLNNVLSSEYESVSGISTNDESADMQTLRSYYSVASNFKKATSDTKKWADFVNNVEKKAIFEYYNRVLPEFSNLSFEGFKELNKVNTMVNSADRNGFTKTKRSAYSNLVYAQNFAFYGEEYADEIEKEKIEFETKVLAPNVGEYIANAKESVSLVSSCLDNIIIFASLIEQKDSLMGILQRTKEYAKSKGDNTYVSVATQYIQILQKEDDGKGNPVVEAAYGTVRSELSNRLNKYVWSKTKKVSGKVVASSLVKEDISKKATSMYVSQTMTNVSSICSIGTFIGDEVTGFGEMCEKLYELEYLKRVKSYASMVYRDDKNSYLAAKEKNNLEEQNMYAKRCLDDLEFLKKLTLRSNEIGYKMVNSSVDSGIGKLLDWIDGCDTQKGLKNLYNNMQSALVDTLINPFLLTPFTVEKGEKLILNQSLNIASYVSADGIEHRITGLDTRFMGGLVIEGDVIVVDGEMPTTIIMLNGGSIAISDEAKLYCVAIEGSGSLRNLDGKKGGDIYIDSEWVNSGNVQVKGVNVYVDADLVLESTGVFENVDGIINVQGDFLVGCKKGEEGEVESFPSSVNSYFKMTDSDGVLSVKGDTYLYGVGGGGISQFEWNCPKLTEGTLKMYGDLIMDEVGQNPNAIISDSFKMVFCGDNPTIKNIIYASLGEIVVEQGVLNVKNCNKYSIAKLGSDLNLVGDVCNLDIQDYNEKQLTIDGNFILTESRILNRASINVSKNMECHTGTVELQDTTINIDGDLEITSAATLNMGNGVIETGGNLYVGCFLDEEGKVNQGSESVLKMDNDECKLTVKEDAYLYGTTGGINGSWYCSQLSKGTLEIMGNLIWRGNSAYADANISDDFNLTLSGKTPTIKNAAKTNHGKLMVSNKTLKLENCNDFIVSKLMDDVVLEGDIQNLNISDWNHKSVVVDGNYENNQSGSLQGADLLVNGNLTIQSGTVELADSTIGVKGDVNVINAATVTVGTGNMQIDGNLYVGCYKNEEGNVVAKTPSGGDYIVMNDEAGKILVSGNTYFYETFGTYTGTFYSHLKKGTLEMKGDLVWKENSSTNAEVSDDFKFVFSGNHQTIRNGGYYTKYGSISSVNDLILDNCSKLCVGKLETDITFIGNISSLSIGDWNSKKLEVIGDVVLEEAVMQGDSVLCTTGSLKQKGDLTLKGNTQVVVEQDYQLYRSKLLISEEARMSVNGNMNVNGTGNELSNISIGGKLDVMGNVNSDGYCVLNMETPDCSFTVYGDLALDNRGTLTDGCIYLNNQLKKPLPLNGTRIEYLLRGISIKEDDISTFLGESVELHVVCVPEYASLQNCVWESSDDSVLTVSPNGNITIRGEGKATITVSKGALCASCNVTVNHKHDLTRIKAKQPNCIEDGNSEYYECSCGKWFEDSEALVEIADYSTILLPAYGHNWNPAIYEWAEDNSSVTATCICKNDSSHIISQTVSAMRTETVPTCEEPGIITYKAQFSEDMFNEDTRTVEVAAFGHDWGEWAVVKDATESERGEEQRICNRNNEHVQSRWIPEKVHQHILVRVEEEQPSCTDVGHTEYYMCDCGKWFTNVDGLEEIVDHDAVVLAAIGHDWDDAAYEWSDNHDTVTAKRICKRDSSHVETEVAYSVKSVQPAVIGGKSGEAYTAVFMNPAFVKQTFTVENAINAYKGDINGDGEVNAKDRMYLARALAGWDGYTVPGVELADFNGDGEVNAKDRMYLARKLAGWEGYE